MNLEETELDGVVILKPQAFEDDRGWFLESWSRRRYEQAGIGQPFVQDNVSFSQKGVLRGLHFQNPNAQGKLVQVLSGEVYDVAVDIRVGSPSFGKWVSAVLSASNHKQMYVPAGFAHGFVVLSETAVFSYKCTDYYNPAAEGGVIWNDPEIDIDWPTKEPLLSKKDATYPCLKDIPADKLPRYEGDK